MKPSRRLVTVAFAYTAFVSVALPAGLDAAAGPAYLVKDIDTTGEPVVIHQPCTAGFCPPDQLLYGGYPSQLTAVGGAVFFEADDHVHGAELWVSDGTARGTRMVADVCPGPCDGWPRILGALGAELLFWADDGTHGGELWKTDGTASGTALVSDVCPGACPGYSLDASTLFHQGPAASPELGGSLFFEAEPARQGGAARPELWRSDGTAEGTALVLDLCADEACSFPQLSFGRLGSSLLVGVWGAGPERAGLWQLASPTAAPERLTAFAPRQLVRLGNRVLFPALISEGSPGERPEFGVFSTDGTAAGTEPIFARRAVPELLVRLGEALYFVVVEGSQVTFWRTDGTAAGTAVAWRAPAPLEDVFGVAAYRGELYFTGLDGETLDTSLWRTTGRVSSGVPLLEKGHGPFLVAGDRLYFQAFDITSGGELWVTDGSVEGTHRVQDLAPGLASSGPSFGPVADHRLFFAAEDGVHDRELWALPVPENGGPPTPDAPPITSPEFPGFRFWVRIDSPGSPPRIGARAASCLPETVCVTGALPGRIEVFVRIVGPKPNGRLWPTIVKFSTSEVEVWIEQTATGALRYYDLAGARPGVDELPGLFDRQGFEP